MKTQTYSGRALVYACAVSLAAGTLLAQGQGQGQGPDSPGRPSDEDPGMKIAIHTRTPTEGAPTAGSTGTFSPISYHGGPVMGTPNVYLIWYGNWNAGNGTDTPAGQAIVRDFLLGLSNSGYYQINHTYGAPSGAFLLAGEATDTGSKGNHLSDTDIKTIVTSAIASNQLGTLDGNGIYFVLTSSNIAKTGFCSQYCGWHTAATIQSLDPTKKVKYSFVGNSARCLNSCAAQTVGPNGNAGVDGMLSVLAHELEEANTDPELNAWYDARGAENADKCAWTFGQNLLQTANGAYYNLTLPAGSNNHYLIQRNLAVDNKCYVDYSTSPRAQ